MNVIILINHASTKHFLGICFWWKECFINWTRSWICMQRVPNISVKDQKYKYSIFCLQKLQFCCEIMKILHTINLKYFTGSSVWFRGNPAMAPIQFRY